MADVELRARRAAKAKQAGRAAQPSAMALAQLLAVKRRAERALQHIGRCTDELAAHHRPKVARGARSRPGMGPPPPAAPHCDFVTGVLGH
eukprot:scaffold73162_cov87-Phaeocystis_antarctica.AAC.1